jgi:hypothetical protein
MFCFYLCYRTGKFLFLKILEPFMNPCEPFMNPCEPFMNPCEPLLKVLEPLLEGFVNPPLQCWKYFIGDFNYLNYFNY